MLKGAVVHITVNTRNSVLTFGLYPAEALRRLQEWLDDPTTLWVKCSIDGEVVFQWLKGTK